MQFANSIRAAQRFFVPRAVPAILASILCACLAYPAQARECGGAATQEAIEVGFSPNGGAEDLVIKAIDSSKKSLRVLAYSFTSKPIAQALVGAAKRGVDVKVVVDKSQNSERYSSATFLANMGIPVRVDYQHAIMHSKVIVVDEQSVETGSFNYTSSAARRNAENAIVLWNSPKLAAVYIENWNEHWNHSEPYEARD
jgi:phosphatidylserine/phosphatidylglycerophosphate/cardiolipin synthase-like enzyme